MCLCVCTRITRNPISYAHNSSSSSTNVYRRRRENLYTFRRGVSQWQRSDATCVQRAGWLALCAHMLSICVCLCVCIRWKRRSKELCDAVVDGVVVVVNGCAFRCIHSTTSSSTLLRRWFTHNLYYKYVLKCIIKCLRAEADSAGLDRNICLWIHAVRTAHEYTLGECVCCEHSTDYLICLIYFYRCSLLQRCERALCV